MNITLEPSDVEHLDELSAKTGKSRSEIIRAAIRAYQVHVEPEIPASEALRLLDVVRIDFPDDPVAMIRSMRDGRRTT